MTLPISFVTLSCIVSLYLFISIGEKFMNFIKLFEETDWGFNDFSLLFLVFNVIYFCSLLFPLVSCILLFFLEF